MDETASAYDLNNPENVLLSWRTESCPDFESRDSKVVVDQVLTIGTQTNPELYQNEDH